MRDLRWIGFVVLAAVGAVGCDADPAGGDVDGAVSSTDGGPRASDGGSPRVPAAMCAPECAVDPPYSAESIGLDSTYACYDGCNWFYCTVDGPQIITARACSDGGVADAAP